MFLQYRDIEIAVNQNGFFRKVYYDISIRRGWFFSGIIFCICNYFVSYFSADKIADSNIMNYSTSLIIFFIILINIIGLIEKYSLKNFSEMPKEKKLSKIKLIFHIEQISFFTLLTFAMNSTKSFSDSTNEFQSMLIKFAALILISLVIGFIFSYFSVKKIIKEIESKNTLLC